MSPSGSASGLCTHESRFVDKSDPVYDSCESMLSVPPTAPGDGVAYRQVASVVLEPRAETSHLSDAGVDDVHLDSKPCEQEMQLSVQVGSESAPTRLHLAIWDNDVDMARRLVIEHPELFVVEHAQEQPLRLATRLMRHSIVKLLLESEADLLMKDREGWRGAELVRNAFRMDETGFLPEVAKQTSRQRWINFQRQSETWVQQLLSIPDCDVSMTWIFETWVPLVGRLLPQDSVRMRKRGASLRFDYSLKGFSGVTWQHGDYSMLVVGKQPAIHFIDHDQKTFRPLEKAFMEKDDDAATAIADRRRRNIVMRGELDFSKASVRNTSKIATCGCFNDCKVFDISGVEQRTLALPIPPGYNLVPHQVAAKWRPLVSFAKTIGFSRAPMESSDTISLAFHDYFPDSDAKGHAATVESLPPATVKKTTVLEGTVLMSDSFPLSKDQCVAMTDAIAVSDQRYDVLKEFFASSLPPGFPVQFTIPLFAVVSGTVSFTEARLCTPDEVLFELPNGYELV